MTNSITGSPDANAIKRLPAVCILELAIACTGVSAPARRRKLGSPQVHAKLHANGLRAFIRSASRAITGMVVSTRWMPLSLL